MHIVVTDEVWIAARRKLLADEKALQKRRDELATRRRELPWRKVRTDYEFDAESGNAFYNYRNTGNVIEDMHGLSAFKKAEHGSIYHTYSTFSRGLDSFNSAYQLLDLVADGRNEDDLTYSMDWLRRRDEY